MTKRIDKIENSKHKQERILVFLSDGTLIKVTKAELLNYHLQVGQELPSEIESKLCEDARKSDLRVQAAQMASRRIQSKKEIVQKLKKKGAQEQEANEIVAWLEELGAVDDETYAGVIVRHYSSMGYGVAKIRQEFMKRGIDKDVYEEALKNIPDPKETLLQLIDKKIQGKEYSKENIQKISNALLRRGYSWNEIREAWKSHGEILSEEDL